MMGTYLNMVVLQLGNSYTPTLRQGYINQSTNQKTNRKGPRKECNSVKRPTNQEISCPYTFNSSVISHLLFCHSLVVVQAGLQILPITIGQFF